MSAHEGGPGDESTSSTTAGYIRELGLSGQTSVASVAYGGMFVVWLAWGRGQVAWVGKVDSGGEEGACRFQTGACRGGSVEPSENVAGKATGHGWYGGMWHGDMVGGWVIQSGGRGGLLVSGPVGLRAYEGSEARTTSNVRPCRGPIVRLCAGNASARTAGGWAYGVMNPDQARFGVSGLRARL